MADKQGQNTIAGINRRQPPRHLSGHIIETGTIGSVRQGRTVLDEITQTNGPLNRQDGWTFCNSKLMLRCFGVALEALQAVLELLEHTFEIIERLVNFLFGRQLKRIAVGS